MQMNKTTRSVGQMSSKKKFPPVKQRSESKSYAFQLAQHQQVITAFVFQYYTLLNRNLAVFETLKLSTVGNN